jgi:hypothetical protein
MRMLKKSYEEPSVFTPENLLREARRQKSIAPGEVPRVCILDPDGDIVKHLARNDRISRCPHWACYHTVLYEFLHEGVHFGIIGCAVGAAFAVLVAEQLFASGCRLLISITSAGSVGERPPGLLQRKAARRTTCAISRIAAIPACEPRTGFQYPRCRPLSTRPPRTWPPSPRSKRVTNHCPPISAPLPAACHTLEYDPRHHLHHVRPVGLRRDRSEHRRIELTIFSFCHIPIGVHGRQ